MLRRYKIGKLERGFLYKDREYVRYLRPGKHWVWGFGWRLRLSSLTDHAIRSEQGGAIWASDFQVLTKDPELWRDVEIVQPREHERALVWVDGKLAAVYRPGFCDIYWKVGREVRVEVFDARAIRFEHESLESVLALESGKAALQEAVVPPGSVGLLLVDEKVRDELGPGRYALWKGVARARVEVLDRRELTIEITGQEVLTKDKATLRLNLVAAYKVVSPRVWFDSAQDARSALYKELQLAVRAAVGSRTLDELLAAKDSVGVEVRSEAAKAAEAAGASLLKVGLKDVILPGEMRTLMNQVLEAEKRAQANLIERREETAATRALLNTAKLYAEHPALLRLKELETAERIAGKVAELRVTGVDDVLARLLPSPKQN